MAQEKDVCVVGCGLMGSAMARVFAGRGRAVTAWNRTFAKAEALAGDRITAVSDIADAVRGADAIVACTATYDNLYAALESVQEWSHGQRLINLTSGTPQESAAFAEWAAQHGLVYLDGSLFCYPRALGSDEALLVYSGDPEAWEACRPIAELLGRSRFVAGDPGLNSILLQGMAAYVISTLGGYVEAIAYLVRKGLPTELLGDTSVVLQQMLVGGSEEALTAIESDRHESDQATVDTFFDGAEHVRATMAADGFTAPIFLAATQAMEQARSAGYGHLGMSALARLL